MVVAPFTYYVLEEFIQFFRLKVMTFFHQINDLICLNEDNRQISEDKLYIFKY